MEPWNISNCPKKTKDREDWVKRCRSWCGQISNRNGFSLKTHYDCPKCGFGYIYRTGNYSLSSSADVENTAVCCNPDCRYEWNEYS
ncbi:MAG TPA: hypothetical protein PK683_16170 [Leptospiraceae bacterium]|nr:hypothetical protein [Leptospiraceae bacterium]HNH10034.1 hypothetical protein [Leptospiraceae bacterium]